MLKLRLIQPGQPDQHFAFERDCAVLGRKRDGGVDVVVPQGFVSARHAILLKGVVIFDLGSANGTYVGGHRIAKEQPTLVRDGVFTLGRDEVRFVVELDDELQVGEGTLPAVGFAEKPAGAGADELAAQKREFAALRAELERTREEKQRLVGEIESLRRAPAGPGSDALPRLEAALQENVDLKKRMGSLKEELESREMGAAATLQARLAQERLAEVQKRNEELETRMKALEARAPEVRVVAGEDAISVRLLELEAQIREQQKTEKTLRSELESARSAAASSKAIAPSASELFVRLQRENTELREKVTRLEAAASAPGGKPALPASELFFEMQSENQKLRRRIAELEMQASSSPGAPRVMTSDAGREREALEGEVQRLRAELAQHAAKSAPRVVQPVPAVFPTAAAGGTAQLLRKLADADVEGQAPILVGSVEDFLTLETFRFARQVERIVTRLVGNFLQIYDPNTMLPDVSGNVRKLTLAALEAPDDRKSREAFVRYIEELKGWLVAAVGAPRKAAVSYVRELRVELSAEGLTRGAPISALKKLVSNESELWRRANVRWGEITDVVVEDRLEELARSEARKIMDKPVAG